ncbi:MAG: hypothetical protein PHW75_01005 [Patescibacteria group bacterium]|nr:hypothetical protein [Patescibacteria group bacterium]
MEKEKFNWKRLGITVVIVLLAVGATGGTTWYFMDKYAQEQQNELEAQIEELRSQVNEEEAGEEETTEEIGVDETADWKTYTNSEYGFSFMYPTGWVVEDNLQDKGEIPKSSESLVIKFNNSVDTLISLMINPDGLGPIFADLTYDFKIINKELELADRDIVEYEEGGGLVDPANDGRTIISPDNSTSKLEYSGDNYFFTAIMADSQTNKEELIVQILETFKFN